jgi:hypothetical protein
VSKTTGETPKQGSLSHRNREYAVLELAFGNSFFDRISDKLTVPVIIKGTFGPNYRLKRLFKLIFAGLANIAVFKMEIIPFRHRILYGMSAHITGNGFHNNSL